MDQQWTNRKGDPQQIGICDILVVSPYNMPHYSLGEVAVWVDEHHPAAVRDILQRKRLEECGLARPGLPDDVHVGKPVGLLDADRDSLISKIRPREE
jgi:hypothetical protein